MGQEMLTAIQKNIGADVVSTDKLRHVTRACEKVAEKSFTSLQVYKPW
jgi:hypothetical protein